MTPRVSDDHPTADSCSHHWVIDTPNGALSSGHCKRCGATAEFRNSSEDLPWADDRYTASVQRGRRAKRAS